MQNPQSLKKFYKQGEQEPFAIEGFGKGVFQDNYERFFVPILVFMLILYV